MDTDLDTQRHSDNHAVMLCGKAWTAYLNIAVRSLVLLGLGGVVLFWLPQYWLVTALVLLTGLLLIGYQVMYLRSYRLYYDANGVWIYAGLLPWKRGVTGVKWSDLDEAVFVNNFWSWLARSYTVQLRHRFTKDIEIAATGMANGKQAIIAINQQHQHYLRLGRSTATPIEP